MDNRFFGQGYDPGEAHDLLSGEESQKDLSEVMQGLGGPDDRDQPQRQYNVFR
jgi:hypothetical protein